MIALQTCDNLVSTKAPGRCANSPRHGTERTFSMQENRTGLCGCGCGETPPLATETRLDRGHVKGQPLHFCRGHQSRKSPVEYIADEAGCWIWQRSRNSTGYGQTGDGRLAHRVYYERVNGPIGAGLVIDHLCGVRACCNPDHLEAVEQSENCRRGRKAILTSEQVREIKSSPLGCRRLAKQYGVARETILGIRAGRRWANV